jgi:hypothetical protein
VTSSAAKPLAGAIVGPSLGVALALALARIVDPDRGRELGAYAIGTVPLTIVAGAIAGTWARRPATAGAARALAGLVIAVGAALVVAAIEAAFRFHYLGSTGFLSGSTLLYTKEVLMLVGALPSIGALGAVLGRRPARLGPVVAPAVAGAAVSLLVGPTLVLASLLIRLR